MRWAIVIEKVLKIRNAPTNSAIPAKASSPMRRKLRLSRISRDWRSASSEPVRTSTERGVAARMRRLSSAGATPGRPATSIVSKRPALPVMRCASRSVVTAATAPPKVEPPNSVSPTIRSVCAGPVPTTRILSPTPSPARLAAARSSATRASLAGLRPTGDENASKRRERSEETKFGGPAIPSRLPSVLRMTTCENSPPSASCTPGTPWIRRRTDSRIDGLELEPPWSPLIVSCGVTATSVRLLACWKILSNDRLIVSVSTYVPAISATPSATASAVSARRSLRARKPFSATRIIRRPPVGDDRRRRSHRRAR